MNGCAMDGSVVVVVVVVVVEVWRWCCNKALLVSFLLCFADFLILVSLGILAFSDGLLFSFYAVCSQMPIIVWTVILLYKSRVVDREEEQSVKLSNVESL